MRGGSAVLVKHQPLWWWYIFDSAEKTGRWAHLEIR
jgi:hypothetical protein